MIKVSAIPVCFEASQPVTDSDKNPPVTLSAVARRHVAFSVAEFFPDTREVRLIGADHLSSVDKYKIMIAIVAMIDPSDKEEFGAVIGNEAITPP